MRIKPFLKNMPSLKGIVARLPLVRRLAGDEQGATLVYVAISLPVILGFAGLGVDIAVWNLDKRESQAMADAAAMAAGISVMRTGTFTTITSTATTGAIENGFSAANGDVITVNNPPSVGPRSAAVWGDPDGDGISGDTAAIEVFIRRPAPALFSSIIMATDQFVQSRTVVNAINDPGDSCFMALDPVDTAGITISGNAEVGLDCGIMTNGSLIVSGTACVDSTSLEAVTVVSDPVDSCDEKEPPVSPTPTITRPDPLRFMPEVDERVCDRIPTLNIPNGTVEWYPRQDGIFVFCGNVRIQPTATLIFHPGVYVFHQGAKLTIGGTLDASAGAMFYFTEDAGMSAGGPLAINAGAMLTINPLSPGDLDGNDCNSGSTKNPPGPTLGTCSAPANIDQTDPANGDDLDEIYEGIAFFQDRDAKAANGDDSVAYNFSGDSNMLIDGVIYLPGGDVNWLGGSSASANAIVSDSIRVGGNADFGTIEGTILETLLAWVFIKIIE